MSAQKKVRVAFFDFACCEGCQIELTNLSDPIFVGLLDHVEFVEFREAMSERTTEPIDIAFVEGSFTREADRARLEDIRRRASIVIAYGACAATAGINAMKNHTADYKDFVYGKDAALPHLDSQKALPVSAAIKVDYSAPRLPDGPGGIRPRRFPPPPRQGTRDPQLPGVRGVQNEGDGLPVRPQRPLPWAGGPGRLRRPLPRRRDPLRGLPRVLGPPQ